MTRSRSQTSVWLNDVELPIVGKVVRRKQPPWPANFTTGPKEFKNKETVETQVWENLKGGMGLEEWSAGNDDRFWDSSDMETALNFVTLGPLVTTIDTGGSFGVAPEKIIGFEGNIFAIGHQEIAYMSGGGWTTAEPATPLDNPTDARVFYSGNYNTVQCYTGDHVPTSVYDNGSSTWNGLRGGGGDGTSTTTLKVGAATDIMAAWDYIYRHFQNYDLSEIPAGSSIISAKLWCIFEAKVDTDNDDPLLNIYKSTAGASISSGDYDACEGEADGEEEPMCDTPLQFDAVDIGSWYSFTLNTYGLAYLNTQFGASNSFQVCFRTVEDADDDPEGWGSEEGRIFQLDNAENMYLQVEYVDADNLYTPNLVVSSAGGTVQKTESATGASWEEVVASHNVVWLSEFQNRLCGLGSSETGFYYTDRANIDAAWNSESFFPNTADTITKLFTAKNAAGDPALFMLTTSGMWYLDVYTNFNYGPHELQWAKDSNSGKCAIYWHGDIYVAAYKSIYKVSGTTISPIGPDQDDGLPDLKQGVITDMIGVGNWLVITVDNSDTSANYSTILKRHLSGNHWHVVHVSAAVNKRIKCLWWEDSTLYFGEDTDVMSLPFPAVTDNVRHLGSHTFAASGWAEYPKFDGGFKGMNKVAHRVWAITDDCTATEYFNIKYDIDDTGSFTTLVDADNANGRLASSPRPGALKFGTANNNAGLEFENIQFRVEAVRSATTNAPKLRALVFEYRVVPAVLYDWTFTVAAQRWGKKRGQDIIDAITTAVETATLLAFYPEGHQGGTKRLVQVKGDPIALSDTVKGQEGLYKITVGEVLDV